MASKAPEEKVKILLAILESVGEFKPNYTAVATKVGINTAQNAQRTFKAIVEAEKTYILSSEKGVTKVVANASTTDTTDDANPTTATKSATAAKSTKTKRKRTNEDEDGEEGDMSTSKAKTTTTKKAKKEKPKETAESD